ncbi:AAA family ATPase [Crocosphaera sp. UHCC 0190]|uniref:bifunctional aminoglycoside phosphotransferase/ATP-binding protein n=1 Tax=Crocosphaera sp. UHCC 0190 TaxID=3110246 RepID=UPI002B21A4DD|nr:AAA family ATPase [Crocosphaera sp. UHCC 0190]MEA5509497.1 AAA family ATPase [Crocosphaera sp. UHCC 0190]
MDISTLIKKLQNPEFYPHSVKTPIEVMQTHSSVVFLTGDYAYKLKKPVNFGFLNYSTLDKRQHFLTQELNMNQVIAPDIYLEVLPITDDNKQLNLSGEGEIIDYILKMNQFPQNCLLINLFEAGKLQEYHLKELGKTIAEFHKNTKTNDYIRSFGDIEIIKKSIDENYQRTEKYIGIAQSKQQYQETKQFTDRYFSANKKLFENRRKHDKIRECHGDLHLKNICLWHDKIQLFDRIEFNEEFRLVDVMFDVAFTVMDLDARNRQDFSNIFLNTYLEYTGDWEGLPVLPVYLSRQAYVRAKVNSMLLDDPNISQKEKQEATQTAANYYHLAWQYTQQHQGQIILMSGLSGSGKTTIAKYLAKQINGILIRSDALRKHLTGIPLNQTGGDDIYTQEMNEKTYNRLIELGQILAQHGFSVILDAKFDRHIWRELVINWSKNNQIPLTILYCDAPREVLIDRLCKRTDDISDATPNLLEEQAKKAELFNEIEQEYVKIIDTTTDWEKSLNSLFNTR